ncbi:MAG: ATP-dependent metallopeptidase FtsH/Yme1/Tma family protein, partial [Pyrinomonadaceae bacterium]
MTLSSTARQIIFWLLIVAGALLLYKLVNPNSKNSTATDLTTLYARIEAGEIKAVNVKQNETIAQTTRGEELRVQLTNEHMKSELFKKANEMVNGKPRVEKFEDDSGNSSYIWPMLITWAPLLFI